MDRGLLWSSNTPEESAPRQRFLRVGLSFAFNAHSAAIVACCRGVQCSEWAQECQLTGKHSGGRKAGVGLLMQSSYRTELIDIVPHAGPPPVRNYVADPPF